jgi:hypothetical protein
VGTSRREEDTRKGWRANVVEMLCTLYENGKVRPVETIPGMGRGG